MKVSAYLTMPDFLNGYRNEEIILYHLLTISLN
jgi:hypothetical protein